MHGDRIAEMGLRNAIENELTIIRNTGQYATEMLTIGELLSIEQAHRRWCFSG
jgi:hypothetical protein